MSSYVPPATRPKVNGLAVAGMIFGILWLFWLGSIIAVVFGHVSLRAVNRSEGRQTGGGFAVAAITLGWIGVATLLIMLPFIINGAIQQARLNQFQ